MSLLLSSVDPRLSDGSVEGENGERLPPGPGDVVEDNALKSPSRFLPAVVVVVVVVVVLSPVGGVQIDTGERTATAELEGVSENSFLRVVARGETG